MPFFGAPQSNAEITTASATVTFWCIDTVPAGAFTIDPIRSPTWPAIPHHESAHARTPRVLHVRAYSNRSSSASAGMAPSEFEIRYVVFSTIGNRDRNRRSGSGAGG